ncbi:hypothetical protein PVAND_007682 [Polypedilum vanderplanki]|uniref:Serine protease K12H4.7 n=1 Tax=Polypedilum vanderplanki TaxID=319348 RepID=A0A9J6C7E6_POLVA|nr:hypothetical protein PVAND_007682 [Polypedilum vanderplanki]
MKTFLLRAIAFIALLHLSDGWRLFKNGRRYGGNLGDPDKYRTEFLANQDVEDFWFTQKLDHFDPTNNKTWQQRYNVNRQFFKHNGPVFLMIGGEGEMRPKWIQKGAWIVYAQKFGALCFQLEHRFYGKSHPTNDMSTENLRFLSSEQALADLAYFVTRMNEQYNLTVNNRWIAFGGSYPGSLAAWVREKYGHLIHGSISTSGPLLAKIDFFEYFEVVRDSLATYKGCDCVEAVQSGTKQIDVLLRHMIGQRTINEKFKLCDPVEKSIENPLDISNLFEGLASNFAGVVQYNKDKRDGVALSIDDVCGAMCNQTIGAPVTRLAEVNRMVLESSNQKCFDYKYDKMIDDMKNISWGSSGAEGGRQWMYQTCTEFGFYQTSDKPTLLFGDKFPADFFVKQCSDIFGENFNQNSLSNAIDRTNIIYGALKPSTTNVLYVHGSIDPWHALGLTKTDKNQPQPTIYIQGTAHCANMYEPSDDDFPQLKIAREEIVRFLENLLKK